MKARTDPVLAGNLLLLDPGWYQERNLETPAALSTRYPFDSFVPCFFPLELQLSCTGVAPAIGC